MLQSFFFMRRKIAATVAAVVVAIVVTGCQSVPLRAQDEKPAKKDEKKETPKADPDSAVGKFQAAIADFDDKQATLQALRKEYQTAKEARQKEIATEFDKTVAGLQESLPKIRDLALAAYDEKADADPKVLEFLTAMINRDLSLDKYEETIKHANVLIEKGCKDAMVLGLAGQAAYALDQFDQAEKFLTDARANGRVDRMSSQILGEIEEAKEAWAKEQEVRKAEAEKDDNPRVKIETSKGVVIVELYENEAPDTVGNFVSLVKKKFYDGIKFHRVLPNFMAQAGCPNGLGNGGPGYKIFCECDKPEHRKHFRGTLSMAKTELKNTGGSQFFLTFRRTSHLDGKHTVFGRVIEGLEILEKLQRIDPQSPSGAEPDKIVKATVIRDRGHEYKPNVAAKGD